MSTPVDRVKKSLEDRNSRMKFPSASPSISSPDSDPPLTLFQYIYDWYDHYRRSRYFIAGLHYFLSGMRVILERFYRLSASYSNQYDLHYRWKHIYTRQENEWDCGVACCAMVLKWANQPSSLIYQHEIALRGTPLWSLDLLLCLSEHKLKSTLYTTSVGIQSHHENYDWYQNFLEQDKLRMERQLDQLSLQDLNIVQVSTPSLRD